MSMKAGLCPICGSQEIYTEAVYDRYSVIAITISRTARKRYYVCTTCGYVETYIMERDMLRHIREQWHRVEGPPESRESDRE